MRARASSGEAMTGEKRGRQPIVTRVVVCISRTFCSTDQGKRETARSLVESRNDRAENAWGLGWVATRAGCL